MLVCVPIPIACGRAHPFVSLINMCCQNSMVSRKALYSVITTYSFMFATSVCLYFRGNGGRAHIRRLHVGSFSNHPGPSITNYPDLAITNYQGPEVTNHPSQAISDLNLLRHPEGRPLQQVLTPKFDIFLESPCQGLSHRLGSRQ